MFALAAKVADRVSFYGSALDYLKFKVQMSPMIQEC